MVHHVLLLLVVLVGAVHMSHAEPLPLPQDPTTDCGPSVFYEFTKHNRACSIHFYHRDDPDADCCEGLAFWYGPNSTLPSRNCFCDKTYYEEFQAVTEKTYYQFETAFKMCTAQGFTVPWYQEDDNGTATGVCAGDPVNATEYASVCMSNCPSGTAASVDNWASRLPDDRLVLASVVTGAISGVGVLLLLLPMAMDLAQDGLSLVKRKLA